MFYSRFYLPGSLIRYFTMYKPNDVYEIYVILNEEY